MKWGGWIRRAMAAVLCLGLCMNLVEVARADEVKVVQYPDSNYDPGPGWPEGWTPPSGPSELSPNFVKWLEEKLKEYPQLKRWEVRVLDPLPKWTQEYPYEWVTDKFPCGDTIYVYRYPTPDTAAIYRATGQTFLVTRQSSTLCEFRPVSHITKAREPSAEEIAGFKRAFQMQNEVDAAHPGLQQGYGTRDNGTPESVFVYLNAGAASPTFDVPAYLDTSVWRVRVPIRFISELMGASVGWEEASGKVTIQFPEVSREVTKAVPAPGYTYDNIFSADEYLPNSDRYRLETRLVTVPAKTIILTVGQPTALVNGQEVALDAPPVIKQGRTMVPIRFIAEQMGSKVYWVGEKPIFDLGDGVSAGTYQVHIFTPFFPVFEYPSWHLEQFAQKV